MSHQTVGLDAEVVSVEVGKREVNSEMMDLVDDVFVVVLLPLAGVEGTGADVSGSDVLGLYIIEYVGTGSGPIGVKGMDG